MKKIKANFDKNILEESKAVVRGLKAKIFFNTSEKNTKGFIIKKEEVQNKPHSLFHKKKKKKNKR